jgi:co-chaperonin GroES (HSP10)
MNKTHADIDNLTPTKGLIDLKDHSSGQGPLLLGYELNELFDDIILATYVDLDDTGDNLMRDGIVLPGNAAERAWRIAKVILCGPRCTQVKSGDHVIFPNEFGMRATNISVSGVGKIDKSVFLNEQRIFGTCSMTKNESSASNTRKTSSRKRTRA